MLRILNLKTGKDLTLTYNKSDVTLLADIFEIFIASFCREDKINRLYFVSVPGYTRDAGVKYTKIELEFMQEADLLLIFENAIRGGKSGCIGKRYVVSVNDKQF